MADTHRVGDIDLYAIVRGNGTPLVLLHGFPLDHTMWEAQIEAFATRCRLIALDQRGFGRSSLGKQPLTIERMADDLAALLDALQVREPAIICGLSMGGYVSLVFHRKYAPRVRALILCDTRPGADTPAGFADRQALIERVRTTGSVAVVDALLPKLLAPATFDRQPDVVERVRKMMLAKPPASMVAGLHGLASRPDTTNHLRHIDVPTLAIVGEYDALTTPAVMAAMADAIPQCRQVVIPQAGHMTPMENPSAFNEAVIDFLSQPGVLE
jgi:3-oxoadipate enol-lactonase